MSLEVKNAVIKEKKPYMKSLVCLIIVLVSTICLKIGNNILDEKNSILTDQINENHNRVESLQAGSNLLQVSHLYNQNRDILNRLESRSDIVKYIEHIVETSRTYNISMDGFDYSGDEISLTILSRSQAGDKLAYKNIVKLLQEYGNSPSALFKLGYITSLSGHDSMKFGARLFIK